MPLLAAIALLSAAAIAYEVVLTRLFAIALWHHFAQMVISLALLGYGASGTLLVFARQPLLKRFGASFAAFAAAFGVTAVGSTALAWRLPFNPLEIIWDWHQQLYLAAMYVTLALPFCAAASAIGLGLAARPVSIGLIYRADLIGAGLGALAIVAALFVLRPEDCLRLLAGAAFLAAALAAFADGRRRLALCLLFLIIPAALAWPAAWLKAMPSPYKQMSLVLNVPGARIIAERTGPLGQVSVIENGKVPLRYAPGLSLATKLSPPDQLGIFTDGEGMTVVTRFDGDFEKLGYLDQQTASLPFHLLDHPATLVLGSGGGADVLTALFHGARQIDAVELNPQIARLVTQDFGDFAGQIFQRSEVTLHVDEARSFIEASGAEWKLIQLSLLDSFAASVAGVQALRESPIYTVEALRTYLDHLAPGGMLAITRWLGSPPRETLKLFATAIAALAADGETSPGRRLILLHGWSTATLLVKNGPFTEGEVAAVGRFAADRQFDLAWYPGIRPGEANRYNRMASPTLHDAAVALLGSERPAFLAGYKFDIRPATDDRPFFYRFFTWKLLPELVTLRGQGGLVFVDSGYLVSILALVQATAAAVILMLLPLAALTREPQKPSASAWWRVALYFLLLGLAFLLVEIGFIHRFSLFLGHPLSAIAVTLASFLVSAGLGSGMSDRIAQRWPETAIPLAVAAIIVLGAAYGLLLPPLFAAAMGLPLTGKIVIAAGLIAPLGFAMGLPFPLGLGRLAREAPDLIPWAWGINGCASVVAAVLASLVAMEMGFTAVLALALGLYAAAALVFKVESSGSLKAGG
jgi:spermidine synthase